MTKRKVNYTTNHFDNSIFCLQSQIDEEIKEMQQKVEDELIGIQPNHQIRIVLPEIDNQNNTHRLKRKQCTPTQIVCLDRQQITEYLSSKKTKFSDNDSFHSSDISVGERTKLHKASKTTFELLEKTITPSTTSTISDKKVSNIPKTALQNISPHTIKPTTVFDKIAEKFQVQDAQLHIINLLVPEPQDNRDLSIKPNNFIDYSKTLRNQLNDLKLDIIKGMAYNDNFISKFNTYINEAKIFRSSSNTKYSQNFRLLEQKYEEMGEKVAWNKSSCIVINPQEFNSCINDSITILSEGIFWFINTMNYNNEVSSNKELKKAFDRKALVLKAIVDELQELNKDVYKECWLGMDPLIDNYCRISININKYLCELLSQYQLNEFQINYNDGTVFCPYTGFTGNSQLMEWFLKNPHYEYNQVMDCIVNHYNLLTCFIQAYKTFSNDTSHLQPEAFGTNNMVALGATTDETHDHAP